MAVKTDREIISQVLQGRSEEYRWIVDKYKGIVYTITFRILRNREDAEEAAQDAFINCYRGLQSFNWDSEFRTWLYRIAYNKAVSKQRERKSRPIAQSFDTTEEQGGGWIRNEGADKLDLEDKRSYINKALFALGEEDAALVTLFYFEELSVEEIHSITGMTRSNIKVRLYRARRQMLDKLKGVLKIEVGSLYE